MGEMFERNLPNVPKQYYGQYARMAFPPYKYREYPKMVTLPNGKDGVVNSQAEELRILSSAQASEMVPEAPIVQERNLLVQEVEVLQNETRNKDLELAELRAKLLALEAADGSDNGETLPLKKK